MADAPGHPTDAGRAERLEAFWRRHGERLAGRSVLDVGCDRRHLASAVEGSGGTYWGIGRGGAPDQEVDLEQATLPFADGSFDAVLCLDVLEHLEAAHAVFDELCRVARSTVIVGLPGPWADLYAVLRSGPYRPGLALKYYGLPIDRPGDRHRWFFPADDGLRFVAGRGIRAGFDVVEVEAVGRRSSRRHPLRTLAEWLLFRNGVGVANLYAGPTTVVLERRPASESDRPLLA